ncbi:MAG: DUF2079 domain-containing protein, partial [Deltaproteobacteria bacterium]
MSRFADLKDALVRAAARRKGGDLSLAAAWTLIGAYAAVFGAICTLKYFSFAYDDFDLAVHAQVLWNLAFHGSGVSSILGLNFLGNHAHLVSFLLVPLYRILPNPLILLWLQTLALAAAALPLYLIARDVLGRVWSAALVLLYVLYPGLAFTNLYEFHPTVFATLFLSLMLWMYHRRRFIPFLVFLLLAMSCQENIALAAVGIGLTALIGRRPWRWSLVPLVLGVSYFLFCVRVLMPAFNKDLINFLLLYRGLGQTPEEIRQALFLDPAKVAKIVLTVPKAYYLTQLFLPVACLPLLSPAALLALLPFLFQHLVSTRPSDTQIYFHYTAEMIPFIFYAAILGLGRLLSRWNRSIVRWPFIAFILAVAAAFGILIGPYRTVLGDLGGGLRPTFRDRLKQEMLHQVPPQAGVVATFEFLPRLTNRRDLYSFHHVYAGFYTLSDKAYVLPEAASFALIDFLDKRTFKGFYKEKRYENLRAFLDSGAWGIEDVRDDIVLLKKGIPDRYRLYDVLSRPPEPQFRLDRKTSD